MTRIALFIALIFGQQLFAANYGKFKLNINGDFRDASEVEFLLNSTGEFSILSNDDYFDIEALPFFGELTLNFKSGDEDLILASFKLIDNKVLSACSALVDQPNEGRMSYPLGHARLERWNKTLKKYESINTVDVVANEKQCLSDLLKDYEHFEQF